MKITKAGIKPPWSGKKLRAACKAIRAALKCQTIYMGHPAGTTCFDVQRSAIENPQKYTQEYYAKIVTGEDLCERCAASAALLHMSTRPATVRGLMADLVHRKGSHA